VPEQTLIVLHSDGVAFFLLCFCGEFIRGAYRFPTGEKAEILPRHSSRLYMISGTLSESCLECGKLNRDHQLFPACGTVIEMHILVFRKVDGFDGELMQSIAFEVLHQSTPDVAFQRVDYYRGTTKLRSTVLLLRPKKLEDKRWKT
jgi:hypothetical protein